VFLDKAISNPPPYGRQPQRRQIITNLLRINKIMKSLYKGNRNLSTILQKYFKFFLSFRPANAAENSVIPQGHVKPSCPAFFDPGFPTNNHPAFSDNKEWR
jgi:hypothetical protein